MCPTSRISPDVAYLFRTLKTARATLSGSTSGSFRKAAVMCERKPSFSLSLSGFPLGSSPRSRCHGPGSPLPPTDGRHCLRRESVPDGTEDNLQCGRPANGPANPGPPSDL